MEFKPLENEIWVDAKSFTTDYSGHYIVSNLGRCWSFKSNKFIGRWCYDHWYVTLSKDRKEEKLMVGRLMLISFGVPIPEHLKDLPTSKLQTMHLDGNSKNNNISNFAWGDANENANEINRRIRLSEALKGENNHNYGIHLPLETRKKMSEAHKGKNHSIETKIKQKIKKQKPILQYSKDGTFIREWDSASQVELELGVLATNIGRCCRKEKYYKTAGGYVWKYKEEAA